MKGWVRMLWRKLTGQPPPAEPEVRARRAQLHDLRGKLQEPIARSELLREQVNREVEDAQQRHWAADSQWRRQS
jgi:hypothetical protein